MVSMGAVKRLPCRAACWSGASRRAWSHMRIVGCAAPDRRLPAATDRRTPAQACMRQEFFPPRCVQHDMIRLHTTMRRRQVTLASAIVIAAGLLSGIKAQPGVTVAITSPANGARVSGTITVRGTSSGASSVTLAIDNGQPQPANGTAQWSVVIEEGALTAGAHRLTARAMGTGGAQAEASINITYASPGGPAVTRTFEYASSVDGVRMAGQLFVPENFDPAREGPVPLVIHLHGAGGFGTLQQSSSELARRRWIGIAPDGRRWGLAQKGCPWQTSAGYVDNPDPDVGPGEQDIFDAIRWAQANYPIDPDRIYLFGFSMGGRGTYAIGLKNPDFFAAMAPMGPASDSYEIFVRRPEPAACKEGMAGGKPGDSPRVDTMYAITSGRFLIENAYNIPLFHAHGTADSVTNNVESSGIFLHGFHMTLNNGWHGCHGQTNLCFGHTPTLSELKKRHPEGYDWAHMFTPVSHITDPKWISGTPVAAGDEGVEDPRNPGRLLGIMDFFARRKRVHSPDSILYKTYTDKHQNAFWAKLEISTPWENKPGAIRVRRDHTGNSLAMELSRAARVTIDLDRARLAVDRPLVIEIDKLIESTYDPALTMKEAEILAPALTLTGGFSGVTGLQVTVNGTPLTGSAVVIGPNSLSIGPLTVTGKLAVLIQGQVALGQPRPVVSSVVNAASGGPVVAPGSIATIHGSGLATATVHAPFPSLPVSLAGTRVLMGGTPAQLFVVSANLITFVVPASGGTLVVSRAGADSTPVAVQTAPHAPGIFTLDATPGGPAAATHADGLVVSPDKPARSGQTIRLYLTGLGSQQQILPELRVGNAPAQFTYSGPAPGIPGLDQIDFVVPEAVPPGPAVPLTVSVSSAVSNAATLAIAAQTPGSQAQGGLLYFATYHERSNTAAAGNPYIFGALHTFYWANPSANPRTRHSRRTRQPDTATSRFQRNQQTALLP
ncbi:MAG: hypothetical protein C0504_18180 [Candidatus Solibacter sp.]|nr:hypothetical protein [Candidatus Solibacter sp.]